MKKLMIAVIIAVSAQSVMAAKETISYITPVEFMQALSKVYEVVSEGTVEGIDADCSFNYGPFKTGKNAVGITLNQRSNPVEFRVNVRDDQKIKVTRSGDDDYRTIFQWGYNNMYSLTVVHMDDAYDTLTLSSSSTTLTCGAWY